VKGTISCVIYLLGLTLLGHQGGWWGGVPLKSCLQFFAHMPKSWINTLRPGMPETEKLCDFGSHEFI
jgi:hypothetical protein